MQRFSLRHSNWWNLNRVYFRVPSSTTAIASFHSGEEEPRNPNPNRPKTLRDVDGPLACLLKNRGVIRFDGPDTIKFLQGLLTNDVRSLAFQNGQGEIKSSSVPTPNQLLKYAPPVYSALLTPQGRFLYDLVLYRPPLPSEKLDRTGSGPGASSSSQSTPLFADVDASLLDELLDCLKKYRLRAKVEMEDMSKEYACWQCFGGNLSDKSSLDEEPDGSVDATGLSAAEGNNLGWRWYKDPRLTSLGFRGIFPSKTVPPLVESDKEVEEEHYLLWRLEKGVAEGSTEIPKGEAIPLEYNLAGLNAISFDKGCYVGQESVARTHHRGVIRKRLMPLKFVNKRDEEAEEKWVAPKSEVVDVKSDKKVGTVTTAMGCLGMGLVRVEDTLFGGGLLGIRGEEDVRVKVIRPDWWPLEWVQQQQQQSATA
ncbi:hypothetical protein AMTRI_Chr09g43220 [Amborella trichopoda]